MKQQVGGGGTVIPVPTADRARNTLQNVEDLYNLELVTRVFEDGSIPDAKLESGGGGGGGAFAYNVEYGLFGTHNDTATAGTKSIQIGYNADAYSKGAIAIGVYSHADQGDYATAVGYYSYALGSRAVALGLARAYGTGAIGIGNNADAGEDGAISLGMNAYVSSASEDAVAIGKNAYVTATNAIAIGAYATAQHENSVSLGVGVIATATDQVNIGISNVSKITFDTWTPNVAAAKASTHEIPIMIGGVRYNLLASNV